MGLRDKCVLKLALVAQAWNPRGLRQEGLGLEASLGHFDPISKEKQRTKTTKLQETKSILSQKTSMADRVLYYDV